MVDDLPISVHELTEHVADRTCLAQACEQRAWQEPFPKQRGALADIADAHEGHLRASGTLAKLGETGLRPERSARLVARDKHGRRQLIAISAEGVGHAPRKGGRID